MSYNVGGGSSSNGNCDRVTEILWEIIRRTQAQALDAIMRRETSYMLEFETAVHDSTIEDVLRENDIDPAVIFSEDRSGLEETHPVHRHHRGVSSWVLHKSIITPWLECYSRRTGELVRDILSVVAPTPEEMLRDNRDLWEPVWERITECYPDLDIDRSGWMQKSTITELSAEIMGWSSDVLDEIIKVNQMNHLRRGSALLNRFESVFGPLGVRKIGNDLVDHLLASLVVYSASLRYLDGELPDWRPGVDDGIGAIKNWVYDDTWVRNGGAHIPRKSDRGWIEKGMKECSEALARAVLRGMKREVELWLLQWL